MRARVVFVGVVTIGIAITMLAVARSSTDPATAQDAPTRPLLYGEVDSWCSKGFCQPTFVDLPDGSLRVAWVNYSSDFPITGCPSMTLPSDIEGWLIVITTPGTFPEGPPLTVGASESEIQRVIATQQAAVTPPVLGSMTVADARSTPEPEVCEMLVRRTD